MLGRLWDSLRSSVSSTITRQVLAVILVVSLIPLALTMFYDVYLTRNLAYDYAIREQVHRVHSLAMDLDRSLSGVREDVLFLSESEEIKDLLAAQESGDSAEYEMARQSLEQELLAMSRVKKIYYQVRYLDASGMEVARVDFDGQKIFIVPRDQLQDKSNRYYFQETIKLPLGGLYVSPLDLNVEHGEIERPFKPVIRYGTPVWFHGRPAGIVIINVLASNILDQLSERRAPDETIILADEDGYYLYHSASEEKRWGRDLGTGYSLAQDYPELWPNMLRPAHERNEHESVQYGGEFLTYTTFSPPGTDAYRWVMLSIRPKRVVLASLFRFEWGAVGVTAVALILILVLGQWSSARLVYPVRQLTEMATRMGHGDLATKISLPVSNELGLLAQTLDRAREELLRAYRELEERVEQTERQAVQLRAVAQVAREVTAILDIERLLERVVTVINERFDFYHTAIFLPDETFERLYLRAAAGDRRAGEQEYYLTLSDHRAMAYVVSVGKPRVVRAEEDDVFAGLPDWQQAGVTVLLPLRAREEIIGVLVVQSLRQTSFAEDEVAVLQALADQVALSISNARLFQQVRERELALRRVYGEYSREAWAEFIQAQGALGYRYGRHTVAPAGGLWRAEMSEAVQRNQAVLTVENGNYVLAVPVQVRGSVIGVLDARRPEEDGEWTTEEVSLLETLADQLGAALEGARLYQDTRRRAAMEQLSAEITARIRETLDMDTVLRTAVEEIGEKLGLGAIEVHLGEE